MSVSIQVRLATAWTGAMLVAALVLAPPPVRSLAANTVLPPAEKPLHRPNLQPTPADERIAYVRPVVGKFHYTRRTFDDEISSKFLDRYLMALDRSACISRKRTSTNSSRIGIAWMIVSAAGAI